MTDVIKLPTGNPPGNPPGPEGKDFWPTASARGIRSAIEVCRMGQQLGLVTGPSGAGKTTAARKAVSLTQDDDREAIYLPMTRAAESLQAGLLRIAHSLGSGGHTHMGANELHDAIVNRWWRVGSLLVLDEAQFMSDALLHGVRNLWDELDGMGRAPGIVLVGTVNLAERIEGRTARKCKEFDALRGRIGVTVALDRLEADDFAAISAHLGLSGPQAQTLLQAVGRGPGGLHNVRRLLAHAARIAGSDGQIGLSDLRKAAAAMGVAA